MYANLVLNQARSMPLPSAKLNASGAPLLDVPAIARRLDVCEKTVRRFIARGDLHAYRIGRQLRVSEEEYLRFINTKI